MAEITSTLARLALRRDSDLRERARATNLIVEVRDEDAKRTLINARMAWGQSIPEHGPRPFGSPAGFAFEALAEWAARGAEMPATPAAPGSREEEHFWKGIAPRKDHVVVFAPVLKRQWKEAPEGAWLWKLTIRTNSRLGTELQELLTDHPAYFSKWGKLREDYAPEPGAAKDVRE